MPQNGSSFTATATKHYGQTPFSLKRLEYWIERPLCIACENCVNICPEFWEMALKVNPTMHIVGMNVYTMASMVGWSIYPFGKKQILLKYPLALNSGLVLIY